MKKQRLCGDEIRGKMAFWAFLLHKLRGFSHEDSGDGLSKDKAQGGFKDDVFSGEMHSLEAQQHFSPLFACQKFMGGLTVAPHGDGFFLKESRIQRMIFGVGQMLVA